MYVCLKIDNEIYINKKMEKTFNDILTHLNKDEFDFYRIYIYFNPTDKTSIMYNFKAKDNNIHVLSKIFANQYAHRLIPLRYYINQSIICTKYNSINNLISLKTIQEYANFITLKIKKTIMFQDVTNPKERICKYMFI